MKGARVVVLNSHVFAFITNNYYIIRITSRHYHHRIIAFPQKPFLYLRQTDYTTITPLHTIITFRARICNLYVTDAVVLFHERKKNSA